MLSFITRGVRGRFISYSKLGRIYSTQVHASTEPGPTKENVIEADYSYDARKKLDSVNGIKKVKLTDKEIEEKIFYNSLTDSFLDRTPFNKRIQKLSKLAAINQKHNLREQLDKEVDSIVAGILTKETAVDESIDEPLVKDEEADVVSYPFRVNTPIDRKLEFLKTRHSAHVTKSYMPKDLDYGTTNPNVPVSKVPCGGCGAMLHCQNSSLPGYLPTEIFTTCDKHDLRGQICQRCRFLREHDVALNVQISPDDYPKVISVIRDQVAMVVLLVDLLDFPCSIWPGLLEIIGHKRPVCVVGNKIDLIPRDSSGYLNHIKECLVSELEKSGLQRANIKHVSLISATTGFGVEELITKIQHSWGSRGDVYLLGNHKNFAESKFCFDTPGTVNPEQILTLLTLDELMMTLPNRIIQPRTLLVRPGTSFFLAGLGRIDYLEGPHSLMFTAFASSRLPLTLINNELADEMYRELLGSVLLAVPCGSTKRLENWPGLSGKEISIKGAGWKTSAADVVLSSAGWVAVTGEEGTEYSLKVYTPEGRGIHVRSPALLPHAVMLRGNRLERSPAFRNTRLFV